MLIILELNALRKCSYSDLTIRHQVAVTFHQQLLNLLKKQVVRVELLGRVLIFLVELSWNHPQQSLAGVPGQSKVVQTFLPEAEVNDVLDVAGDDGHL